MERFFLFFAIYVPQKFIFFAFGVWNISKKYAYIKDYEPNYPHEAPTYE